MSERGKTIGTISVNEYARLREAETTVKLLQEILTRLSGGAYSFTAEQREGVDFAVERIRAVIASGPPEERAS